MPALFSAPRAGAAFVDGNGHVYAGAKLNFYQTGTTTPQNTYSDAGLTTPNANPVVADANGLFGGIYLAPGTAYKAVLTTSTGSVIWTQDPLGSVPLGSVVQQVFSSFGSFTYTPTPGMAYCLIECVGAGGGGGGTSGGPGTNGGAGGGQAGEYARTRATLAQIGASAAVTVGIFGAGGTAGINPGTAGGDTSVGSLCIAKGGVGGGFGSNLIGGIGGSGTAAGSVGDVVCAGGGGGAGGLATSTSAFTVSGAGGASYFGGGGAGVTSASVAVAGNAGAAYGSGGGGGFFFGNTSSAGGAGKDGAVIITEFVA